MILNFFILAIVVFLRGYFKLGFQNNFYFWNEIFFPVICYSGVLFPLAYFFNRYIFYKFSEKRG